MKTLCFYCWGGMGLIPGLGTKILHASQCGQKKKNQLFLIKLKNKNSSLTSSFAGQAPNLKNPALGGPWSAALPLPPQVPGRLPASCLWPCGATLFQPLTDHPAPSFGAQLRHHSPQEAFPPLPLPNVYSTSCFPHYHVPCAYLLPVPTPG